MEYQKLGEIVTIKYGKDHKGLSNGNIPVYGTGGLMRKVDKYLYDKPSVLIPRKGSLNNVMFVSEKFWTVDTMFWTIVNTKIINPKYLYYYLSRLNLNKLNVGSAVPSLTVKILNEIDIPVPKLTIQDNIVKKISVFDRKINLNNQINDNLLELISLIQNEYSRTISNKVSLKSLAQKIITGKTPSTKIQENYGYDIPFVKIPDMHDKVFIDKTGQSLSLQGANSQKNKYLPANAIMVSCIGTPGLVSLTGSVSQTNQQINSLILEDKFIYWSFLELRSLRSQIGNLGSGGTTINNLNKSDFSKLEIIIPDNDEVLDNFNHIAQPIFERIHTNNIEIRKLTQLKEALLNKLF